MKEKKYTDPKSFTVKRSKWLRGLKSEQELGSCLLSKSGRMCCLGFYMKEMGFKKDKLLGRTEPECVAQDRPSEYFSRERYSCSKNLPTIESKLLTRNRKNSRQASKLMSINDDFGTTDEEKEKLLKKEFDKIGVKIKFID